MADVDFLVNLAIAVGIGGLVGLEREHRRDRVPVIAGVRTFPLVCAMGVLLVRLGDLSGSHLPLAVGLFAVGGLAVALFYIRHTMGLTGLTTPFAMFVVFLAGTLVGFDLRIEGAIIGVFVTFLLVSKDRLHGIAGNLTEDEILSTLQFVTLAFILLPLTGMLRGALDPLGLVGPGRPIDPYGLLLIVLFVSGISFASFLAMRQVGATRGVSVSGLLGGLVNSEAATASLAALARERRDLERVAVVGVLLSVAGMLVRNLAIAAFVDPSLTIATFMLPAVLLMTVASAGLALHAQQRTHEVAGDVRVANPFAIWPAFKFAAIFAVIVLGATAARSLLGEAGVYASALGAFASAGAVIASVGALAATANVPLLVAGQVAVLACLLSVANKALILRATNPDLLASAWRPVVLLVVLGLLGLVLASLLPT
ncbi:MAG TPA: DUF4010 domain-containing protein [Candidatus Thermoplasmatota archaeon]|nr:DUF4010 domain-containing protein [Candidatus Thermoplasmatota archaeon]